MRWVGRTVAVFAVAMAPVLLSTEAAQAYGANPWACGAFVPNPHANGSEISAHATIKCARKVPYGTVQAQLWRKRWFGWEQIGTPGYYHNGSGAKYIDTKARARPRANECYHYRVTAVLSISGGNFNATDRVTNYDRRYLAGKSPGCGVNWK
jgi:hypothetical protein